MIAYQILDSLPAIPEDLLHQALHDLDFDDFQRSLTQNCVRAQYQDVIKYVRGGQHHVAKRILKAPVSATLARWINDHITDQSLIIEWRKTMEDATSWGICHPPHTDRNRDYSLIYNVWTGGADHYTAFYQPKDTSVDLGPCMCFHNYDELQEITRIQIPLHTWTLINGQLIHSIENLPQTRLNIQVSMANNPWLCLARESELEIGRMFTSHG